MSKLTDTLRAALEKKKGVHHVEPDGSPAVEKKAKKTYGKFKQEIGHEIK